VLPELNRLLGDGLLLDHDRFFAGFLGVLAARQGTTIALRRSIAGWQQGTGFT
jgi:hypothetical protein